MIFVFQISSARHRLINTFKSYVARLPRQARLKWSTGKQEYLMLWQQYLLPMDSYIELRRLSRQWRWLKQLKWAGYLHNGKNVREPRPGQLTLFLFCPACPQPGRNLLDTWKTDANKLVPRPNVLQSTDLNFRKVFYRSIVADGNFKADHVRQKRSTGDVWLSEGGGMMPKRDNYNQFLKTAAERPTVSCLFPQCRRN